MSTEHSPDVDLPGVTRRHRFADLYHERTNFQFIKHSRRWLLLSGTMVAVSILLLFVRPLNLGIEFEGGTSWQVTTEGVSPKVAEVRDLIAPLGFDNAKISTLSGSSGKSIRVQAEVVGDPVLEIQDELAAVGGIADADVLLVRAASGDGGTFTMTAKKDVSRAQVERALRDLEFPADAVEVDGKSVTVKYDEIPASPVDEVAAVLANYANTSRNEVSISTVGPTWGESVSRKALQGLFIFFILLALYLAFRFEWKMAASAIVAVVHDIIITAGFYALLQWQVTPATVTAFLTILGFSLYDTVVVFDKVRENERTLIALGRVSYPEVVNRSLNETLMRSLSTTLVAVLPVVSLLVVGVWVMGATALEDFALALMVGLLIGSYSSIFVASPLLAWWKDREPRYRALSERIERRTSGAAARVPARVGAPEPAPEAEPAATAADYDPTGVPGPPAVGRTASPRPRQQRGRKRR
jgi:preprotein translocase subunit SecF